MGSMYGDSLGFSAIIVESIHRTSNPSRFTISITFLSRAMLDASFHSVSCVRKVFSYVSAPEWRRLENLLLHGRGHPHPNAQSVPFSKGSSTPPMMSLRPLISLCESYPKPVLMMRFLPFFLKKKLRYIQIFGSCYFYVAVRAHYCFYFASVFLLLRNRLLSRTSRPLLFCMPSSAQNI